jgi:hypothetical protein
MLDDPITCLATATAAFKSAIEASMGPVERFHAQTKAGVSYLGFTRGSSLLIAVAPYAAGWAVLVKDGRSAPEVISYGETPTLAMRRAQFTDATL